MGKKIFIKLLSLFVVLLSVLTLTQHAVLADSQDDVITDFRVVDEHGNLLTQEIGMWENFRVASQFKLPDTGVAEGDTTRVVMPDSIVYTSPNTAFELRAQDGSVVANAVVNKDTREILITYTNYAATHSGTVGTFHFDARMNHVLVQNPGPVPLHFTVEGRTLSSNPVNYKGVELPDALPLVKSGWPTDNNPQSVSYYIAVNRPNDILSNVTFTDKLVDVDGRVDLSTIEIYKGNWQYNPATVDFELVGSTDVTAQYMPQVTQSADGQTLTIPFGDLPNGEGFVILYSVTLNYVPANGERFRNQATITADNGYYHTSQAEATFVEAGGQAAGYNYTVEIHKENPAGQPLEHATFDVIRQATNQKVGELTTDANGSARLTGLLRTAYIIRETTPPSGYQLLANDIEVAPADFAANGIALKTIVNQPLTRDFQVTKVWDDENNKDGRRPAAITVRLFKTVGGMTTEVANTTFTAADRLDDNTWTTTFTGLATHEAGQEIVYSVKEDIVPHYIYEVVGGTITNHYIPPTTRGLPTVIDDNDDNNGNNSHNNNNNNNTIVISSNTSVSEGASSTHSASGKTLPETGAEDMRLVYLIGGVLISLAGIVYIMPKRKDAR